MNGGVPNKGLNEQLHDILDQSASNSNALGNYNYTQYIMSLLQAEANPNTKGQAGKILSDYLNEKLSDILNELESNRALLGNHNCTQHIMLLLQAGADPNTKGQAGKTLSYYLDEKLRDILNELAMKRDEYPDRIQCIMFLLEAGANQNTKGQDGKTLLHYVAERNDIGGIGFLLKAEADPNVQDQSGKTPFEYVTERNCLQALKDLGYDLDDAHENEGNPTTPDGSVGESNDCSNSSGDDSQIESVKLSDCNTEEDSDYHSDDSRENEESPAKSPNNENWTPTDQQTSSELLGVSNSSDSEDSEDSSDCDDIDHYDTSCGTRHSHLRYDRNIDVIRKKDSFSLAKIKLNAIEIEKYESVWQKIYKIHDDLDKTCDKDEDYYKKCEEEFDEVISQALEQGVMFTFQYKNDKSFVDLMISTLQKLFSSYDTTRIPEFIERTKMSHIISGGATLNEFTQENHDDFVNIICKDEDILSQRDKNISRLNNLAYESIVDKNNKQTHEYDFKAEIDNGHFCIEYPQDSIIEPAKILNHEKAKELNLKVGILQIGESIVKVEKDAEGKRNYKDILKGSIKMSFTTEVGEISIYLSPSKKDGNKIEVEIDDESEARLNKLKAEKKSLGENCLLGGESVLEAIEAKGFKKNGNVPTEPTEITKDVPFTDFTQACSQQINTSVKSR
ncbi:ankyrin repeat domain-containing protein [Wolbachia endosymbiont (group B) of Limnophora tigrina]|uniref:ankyrin repeat domain-containing protein n=1 Tax=Wolbachia endosymbiont (group B) of Limnophora tigrina TaxID=3139317 RepID=UPI0035B54325